MNHSQYTEHANSRITYSNEKSHSSSQEKTKVMQYPKNFVKNRTNSTGKEFTLIPKQFTISPLQSLYNPVATYPLYRKHPVHHRTRKSAQSTQTKRYTYTSETTEEVETGNVVTKRIEFEEEENGKNDNDYMKSKENESSDNVNILSNEVTMINHNTNIDVTVTQEVTHRIVIEEGSKENSSSMKIKNTNSSIEMNSVGSSGRASVNNRYVNLDESNNSALTKSKEIDEEKTTKLKSNRDDKDFNKIKVRKKVSDIIEVEEYDGSDIDKKINKNTTIKKTTLNTEIKEDEIVNESNSNNEEKFSFRSKKSGRRSNNIQSEEEDKKQIDMKVKEESSNVKKAKKNYRDKLENDEEEDKGSAVDGDIPSHQPSISELRKSKFKNIQINTARTDSPKYNSQRSIEVTDEKMYQSERTKETNALKIEDSNRNSNSNKVSSIDTKQKVKDIFQKYNTDNSQNVDNDNDKENSKEQLNKKTTLKSKRRSTKSDDEPIEDTKDVYKYSNTVPNEDEDDAYKIAKTEPHKEIVQKTTTILTQYATIDNTKKEEISPLKPSKTINIKTVTNEDNTTDPNYDYFKSKYSKKSKTMNPSYDYEEEDNEQIVPKTKESLKSKRKHIPERVDDIDGGKEDKPKQKINPMEQENDDIVKDTMIPPSVEDTNTTGTISKPLRTKPKRPQLEDIIKDTNEDNERDRIIKMNNNNASNSNNPSPKTSNKNLSYVPYAIKSKEIKLDKPINPHEGEVLSPYKTESSTKPLYNNYDTQLTTEQSKPYHEIYSYKPMYVPHYTEPSNDNYYKKNSIFLRDNTDYDPSRNDMYTNTLSTYSNMRSNTKDFIDDLNEEHKGLNMYDKYSIINKYDNKYRTENNINNIKEMEHVTESQNHLKDEYTQTNGESKDMYIVNQEKIDFVPSGNVSSNRIINLNKKSSTENNTEIYNYTLQSNTTNNYEYTQETPKNNFDEWVKNRTKIAVPETNPSSSRERFNYVYHYSEQPYYTLPSNKDLNQKKEIDITSNTDGNLKTIFKQPLREKYNADNSNVYISPADKYYNTKHYDLNYTYEISNNNDNSKLNNTNDTFNKSKYTFEHSDIFHDLMSKKVSAKPSYNSKQRLNYSIGKVSGNNSSKDELIKQIRKNNSFLYNKTVDMMEKSDLNKNKSSNGCKLICSRCKCVLNDDDYAKLFVNLDEYKKKRIYVPGKF